MLRRFPHGENFKILGVVYDNKLLMHSAARVIAAKADRRFQALLQAKHYFSMIDLVDYTSHRFCRTSKAQRVQTITHRHSCCNASIEHSGAFFQKSVVPNQALCCNSACSSGVSPGYRCSWHATPHHVGIAAPSSGSSVPTHWRRHGASRSSMIAILAHTS